MTQYAFKRCWEAVRLCGNRTIFAIMLCAIAKEGWAVPNISVTGDWIAPTITEANLNAGAGTDIGPIESVSAQTTIGVTGAGAPWVIRVARDNSLPPSAKVYVRRTSGDSGIGGATVSGGTAYQEITTVATQFLSGTGNFNNNITLQFKVETSVQVSPSTYALTVTYSIE